MFDDVVLFAVWWVVFWFALKSSREDYEFRKMKQARTIAREERERRLHKVARTM